MFFGLLLVFWFFLSYINEDDLNSCFVKFSKTLCPIWTLDRGVPGSCGGHEDNSMSAVGNFKSISDRGCSSSDMIYFSVSTPFVYPPEEEVLQFDLF